MNAEKDVSKLVELLDSDYGKELIIEGIAQIFHESWVDWSREIYKEEKLSDERVRRWKAIWEADYCMIPNDMKKPEIELAMRVLRRLGLL